MPLSEQDIGLIERYIDNDLSQEDKNLIDSKLKEDDFLSQFELYKGVAKAVEVHYNKELKYELKAHLMKQDSYFKVTKNSVFNSKNSWYISGAAAAFAMVVVSFFLWNKSSTNTTTLFASYYKPFPIASVMRGDQKGFNSEAFKKYTDGKYEEAVLLLERQTAAGINGLEDPLLQLVAGNCYLKTNQFEEALKMFKKTANSQEIILSQHATWYYALTLLRQSKEDQAIKALEEIIDSNSIYSTQANTLKIELVEIN
jgi:tetratricopeptide (TPR) repeat protein